jgi:GT2 family glycosyltransferase
MHDVSEAIACGVVAIGRNEGTRLHDCLRSVVGKAAIVVYVDSGSTDQSVALAKSLGCEVVELSLHIPFTAARARNEGFKRVQAIKPGLEYVQFVDGDCEFDPNWLDKASNFLTTNPDVAVVCGRRRERYPDRSIYNQLCDIEWNSAVGETRACGGDAMIRAKAFEQVGGYLKDLIAGEEPELCVRLRAAGWRIWRLDDEMTLHDAAMTRFSQWWKRSKRAGHAFAEGAWLHGRPPERHYRGEARRAIIWGIALPTTIFLTYFISPVSSLILLFTYPAQMVRIALRDQHTGQTGWIRATFLVIGKFPEAVGLVSFYFNKLRGIRGRLIEYK